MLRLLLAQNPSIFVCAKAHDRAYSPDACMLSHAAAFACAKPVYFTCALKRTTGLATRMLACCRMLRLLLAQNPFILRVR